MNHKFDELAKSMAQSVTRRGALKKFWLGMAGLAVAALGLSNRAHAARPLYRCRCKRPDYGCDVYPNISDCIIYCAHPARCSGSIGSL